VELLWTPRFARRVGIPRTEEGQRKLVAKFTEISSGYDFLDH
jgi:hypothetical protein